MKIPLPRVPLGQYLAEHLKSAGNQNKSVTFRLEKRPRCLFIGRIEIKNRGKYSGVVTLLELTDDALTVQIYESADVSHAFTVPFDDLILFYQIKEHDQIASVLTSLPESSQPKTVNRFLGGILHGRHYPAATNERPNARL